MLLYCSFCFAFCTVFACFEDAEMRSAFVVLQFLHYFCDVPREKLQQYTWTKYCWSPFPNVVYIPVLWERQMFDCYADHVLNGVAGPRTQLRDSSVQSRSGRWVHRCNCHWAKQRVCWHNIPAFSRHVWAVSVKSHVFVSLLLLHLQTEYFIMFYYCDAGFMTFRLPRWTSVLCIRRSWWLIISATQHCSVRQSLKKKGRSLLFWWNHL